MKIYLVFILPVMLVQEIPYKPKEEFEVKLNYQFKQRLPDDRNAVNLSGTRFENRTGTGVLPYLTLNIRLLKLDEEKMRLRITRNVDDRVINKKITMDDAMIVLDMGFTDDMKDRVKPYEYTVSFLSMDKEITNQILINVDEDGSFFVNGEKRGKF